MFSLLRNRLGIPGVIAIIALVFAAIGGAWAATDQGGATASAQKQPKHTKSPRGPRGKRGPQGPAGPAGPKGDAGANGEAGAQGAKGDAGATGATGATGAAGAKGATGATGAAGAAGAAGPEGSPWTAGGTLPAGKTETGAWVIPSSTGPGAAQFSISFPIPLTERLSPLSAEGQIIFLLPGEDETATCPGTVENPRALPGHLCIYAVKAAKLAWFPSGTTSFTGGVVLTYILEGAGASGQGSWAVTERCPGQKELEANLNAKKTELKTVKGSLSTAEEHLGEAEARLAAAEVELGEKEANSEDTTEVEEKIEQEEKAIDSLEKEISDLEAEIPDLEAEVVDREQELADGSIC